MVEGAMELHVLDVSEVSERAGDKDLGPVCRTGVNARTGAPVHDERALQQQGTAHLR